MRARIKATGEVMELELCPCGNFHPRFGVGSYRLDEFFVCEEGKPAPSAATETPRTDAVTQRIGIGFGVEVVTATFARELERDLAAKTAELDAANEARKPNDAPLGEFIRDSIKALADLQRDLASSQQRCAELEKALREIAGCPGKCCVTCQTKARVALARKEPR